MFLHGWALLFVHEMKQAALLEGERVQVGEGRDPALPCLWARACLQDPSEESVTFEERGLGIIL